MSGPGALPAALLEQVLAEAFPFHLVLDGAGTVVRAGASLRIACPGLVPGAAVADHSLGDSKHKIPPCHGPPTVRTAAEWPSG